MIMPKRLILSIWAKSWLLAKSPSEQVLLERRGQPSVALGRLASLFQTIQYLGVAATKMGFCTPIYAVVQPWDKTTQLFGQHPDTCRGASFCFLWWKSCQKAELRHGEEHAESLTRSSKIWLHWGYLCPIGEMVTEQDAALQGPAAHSFWIKEAMLR